MAEEEKIIGHAKKAIKVLSAKDKKWKEKAGDFIFEIVIIIVAVNITLWFHNWNDKKHEKQEVKEFLIGIHNDLMSDTARLMREDVRGYKHTLDFYDSVYTMIIVNKINKDYIDNNAGELLNRADFLYDDSRFQSFKSSGNLKLIENQKLLNDITYLYSSDFPVDKSNDQIIYQNRQEDYDKYIGTKTKIKVFLDTNGKYSPYMPISNLFEDPSVQYQIIKYRDMLYTLQRIKLRTVSNTTKVIESIEKELKDKFDYDFGKTEKE